MHVARCFPSKLRYNLLHNCETAALAAHSLGCNSAYEGSALACYVTSYCVLCETAPSRCAIATSCVLCESIVLAHMCAVCYSTHSSVKLHLCCSSSNAVQHRAVTRIQHPCLLVTLCNKHPSKQKKQCIYQQHAHSITPAS